MPVGPNDLNDTNKLTLKNTLNLIIDRIDRLFWANRLVFSKNNECKISGLPPMSIALFEEVKNCYFNAGWKSVNYIGQEWDEGRITTIIFRK